MRRMTDSWDIVFWSSGGCDYIPSSWAVDNNKTKYIFPKGINPYKLKKIVDTCQPPCVTMEYSEHTATFKRTVNSLEKAKRLLEKAVYTSTLDTGGPSDDNSKPDNVGLKASKPSSHVSAASLSSKSSKSSFSTYTPDKVISSNESEDEIGGASIGSVGLTRGKGSDETEFQKRVLHSLEDLKYELKTLKKDVVEVSKNISRLTKESLTAAVLSNSENKFNLPLTSDVEMTALEGQLTEQLTAELCHELALVGGESLRNNINMVMRKLLTKEMSLKYSFKGRKGKLSFSDLNMYKAVLGAVRIKYPTATELEIGKLIGLTLASAKDRDGGRRERSVIGSFSADPLNCDALVGSVPTRQPSEHS